MREKMKEIGRVIQLVVAVLFVFTGILFWDDGSDFQRYLAWLLFALGATNAIFFGLLSSDKSMIKMAISLSNAIAAFIVVFLLYSNEQKLLGSVWAVVGLLYAGIGAWILFNQKNKTSDERPETESSPSKISEE